MARSRPVSIDFYYEDFYSGVASMHPLAVGMFIRILCFSLAHDFAPFDTTKLRRITETSQDEFDKYWPEVEQKLTAIEGKGWIHHRAQVEMDKKVAIAEARSRAGKKGGRPRKKAKVSVCNKQNHKQKKANGKLEVGSNSNSTTTTSSCSTSSCKNASNARDEENLLLFDRFWKAFPSGRRRSKQAALTAWKKAIDGGADPEVLIAKAGEYARSHVGRGPYVQMPSSWLNQGCWEDDPAAWDRKDSAAEARNQGTVERALERYAGEEPND